jgi:hypothetical protein
LGDKSEPEAGTMIANHPFIFCLALIGVAIFSHIKQEKYSPIFWKLSMSWESCWPVLRENVDSNNLMAFEFFFALKWFAIGAAGTIAVIFWNT